MTEKISIYQRLNNVARDIAEMGLKKEGYNEMQRFKFRGIDQIYGAFGPLFAKHGVTPITQLVRHDTSVIVTDKEKRMNAVSLDLCITFFGLDGDSTPGVIIPGAAFDSGDKATSKALSMAMKYAFFQTFLPPLNPTDIDDPDSESPEGTPKKKEKDENEKTTEAIKSGMSYAYSKPPNDLAPDIKKAMIAEFKASGGVIVNDEFHTAKPLLHDEWRKVAKVFDPFAATQEPLPLPEGKK